MYTNLGLTFNKSQNTDINKHGNCDKYYCGKETGNICKCLTFFPGAHPEKGCQKELCGPEKGHNCVSCQKFDLMLRNLPIKGVVMDMFQKAFDLKNNKCMGGWYNWCERGGNKRCNICTIIDALTLDEDALYHDLLS